jgi:quinol monooxygenase YgiN
MVSIVFWLKARRREITRVAAALQSVLQPAQLDRACLHCGVMSTVGAPDHFFYFEEWNSEASLREQLLSQRFTQLLSLMESAAEPPVLEIRMVNDVRGLEYITQLRSEIRGPERPLL